MEVPSTTGVRSLCQRISSSARQNMARVCNIYCKARKCSYV